MGKVLVIRLLYYSNNIPLYYDNNSVINLFKNLIHHSMVKHIEVKYNFIREYVKKKCF